MPYFVKVMYSDKPEGKFGPFRSSTEAESLVLKIVSRPDVISAELTELPG